jgi:hypothetical protein
MIVDNYRIFWKYTNIEVNYLGTKKPKGNVGNKMSSRFPLSKLVTRTECFIVTKDTNEILAHSWVQPHVTDKYDKEKGRKLTLTKALKQFTLFEERAEAGSGRKLRAKIWEAYRIMSSTPKW